MVIVGFDTATAATAVGASRDQSPLFSQTDSAAAANGRPNHTAALLPLVEQAAEACGSWQAIDRIAVGVGPGTFTGIRIGVVTARALAAAHGCQLVAVETTHAVAARAARSAGEAACAVIDGKRGEVFAAIADAAGEQVWGPLLFTPAELAERLCSEEFDGVLAGDGALLHQNVLVASSLRVSDADSLHEIDALEVCRLGAGAGDAEPVLPLYMRRPDAERWIGRDG